MTNLDNIFLYFITVYSHANQLFKCMHPGYEFQNTNSILSTQYNYSLTQMLCTLQSYAKSAHSYELDGSSTEDDSRPSSSLQAQRLPKPPSLWPVKRDSWGSSQSAELTAPQNTTHKVKNDTLISSIFDNASLFIIFISRIHQAQ